MKSAQKFIPIVLGSQFMICVYINFTRKVSAHNNPIRMGWNWSLATSRGNDYWRTGRNILDRGLRPVATASYRPMIQARTRVLFSQLLENPHQWEDHIDLSVIFLSNWHQFLNQSANLMFSLQGALILAVTYGYQVHDRSDRLLDDCKRRNKLATEENLVGNLPINHIPLCMYALLLAHRQHD